MLSLGYSPRMEAGLYFAGGVAVACVTILFVMGNIVARVALALLVLAFVGGYAVFLAYASGFLAYVVERFG